MKNKVYDTLIIGAGIYGLNIAKLLSRKYPEMKIAVVESNKTFYNNNSIYNSGVLHSGVYYKPGSLKSRFCVNGQKELIRYCEENNFMINKCGKVIVGTSDEYKIIEYLYNNGLKNEVNLKLIDLKTAQEFDKHIYTDAEKLIYIPSTSIVSPKQVYESILNQITGNKNIDFVFDSRIIDLLNKEEFSNNPDNKECFKLLTEKNELFQSKRVINCSGPSSDKIAKMFGHCKDYQNVHLKAKYYKYHVEKENMPNILVYPIPGPFSLGLHLTMEDSYTLKFGPSVDFPFLTLKDVSYNYKDFFNKNIELLKAMRAFKNYSQILTEFNNNSYNFGLKRLKKIYKFPDLNSFKYIEKKILIRTPAINLKTGVFESDFIIEQSKNNIHLINFQSPAFTCCFPLSRHVMKLFEDNMD